MSNDLIGELTAQIYDDMGMRAADATVLVAMLYEFQIQQGLVSRKDVHDHLKARAEAMAGSDRFVRLHRQLEAMADLFRDDAPQDLRARLHLIQGGLTETRGH
ncbi:hypothetical protein [Dongia deserti]|uniref:hypothetical protein n=1 Tax=Dongia deserti TaxID=2268030 RepID=UPI000E65D41A|nr:hypothetical protein [Dongia deserti]